jgi:hypothetical protein
MGMKIDCDFDCDLRYTVQPYRIQCKHTVYSANIPYIVQTYRI